MTSYVQIFIMLHDFLGTGTWILRCAEAWKVSSVHCLLFPMLHCYWHGYCYLVILNRNVISLVRCTPFFVITKGNSRWFPLYVPLISGDFCLVIIHLRHDGVWLLQALTSYPSTPTSRMLDPSLRRESLGCSITCAWNFSIAVRPCSWY